MNPDPNNLPREELEVRITALLLGELEAAEAASLRELIERDADLARLHREIGQTLALVREAVAQPAEPSTAAVLPRMAEGKREALLARLRDPAGDEKEKASGVGGAGGATAVSGRVVPVEFPGSDARPGRGSGTWLALAACLIALLGAATVWLAQPRLSTSRVLAMSSKAPETWAFRPYARNGLLEGTTTNGVVPNLAFTPGTPAAGGGDSFRFTVTDGRLADPAPQDRDVPRLLAGGGAMVPPPPATAIAADDSESRGAVQARKPASMEPQLAQRYGLFPRGERAGGAERLNEARKDLGSMAGGLGGGAANQAPGGGGAGFGGGGGGVGGVGGPAGPQANNLALAPAPVSAPAPAPIPVIAAVSANQVSEAIEVNGRVTPASETSAPIVLAGSDADSVSLSYAVTSGGQSAGQPGLPPVASAPQSEDRKSPAVYFGAEPTTPPSRGRMAGNSLQDLRDAPVSLEDLAQTANQPASPASQTPAPVTRMGLVVSDDSTPVAKSKEAVGESLALGRSLNRSVGARPAMGDTLELGLRFDRASSEAAPAFAVPGAAGSGPMNRRTELAAQEAGTAQVVDESGLGERELREKQVDSLDFSKRGLVAAVELQAAEDSTQAKRDYTLQPLAETENLSRAGTLAEESKQSVDSKKRFLVTEFATDATRPSLDTLSTVAQVPVERAGRKEQQADKSEFAKTEAPAEPAAGPEPAKRAKFLVLKDGLADGTAAAVAPAVTPPPQPQPEVVASENPFSTFSLNVSDVSFKLAGASLDQGQLPSPGSIRTEEFLNAFQYRDPDPSPGMPVAFAWERARYPYAHNREILRLAVKTAARGRETGRPLNLVLAVDNSGSMERADRVRILQEAMRTLAGQLQPMDQVSLVSFARTARLWLDGVPGNRAGELSQAVTGLTPEGGTNLEEALRVAYETALKHFSPGGVNRVVLLTDGAANLGDTQPDTLKQSVENYRQRGVALDCFGIGWEGFNDDLLESLSRHGDGRYGFVNAPEDAGADFAAQLAGALQVAASDVKVQVEFNPRRVNSWRQIGYAKHQLTKEQFRDNKVDAAELGAAETGNALYVVENQARGEGPVATVRVRYKVPTTGAYAEHEWVVPYTGVGAGLEQSSPAMRLATTSAAFGEWLASSPFANDVTPESLLGQIAGVPAAFAPDPRPARLEAMIRQAQSLRGR
jgi:Mg-chelatase subunit ChlD